MTSFFSILKAWKIENFKYIWFMIHTRPRT